MDIPVLHHPETIDADFGWFLSITLCFFVIFVVSQRSHIGIKTTIVFLGFQGEQKTQERCSFLPPKRAGRTRKGLILHLRFISVPVQSVRTPTRTFLNVCLPVGARTKAMAKRNHLGFGEKKSFLHIGCVSVLRKNQVMLTQSVHNHTRPKNRSDYHTLYTVTSAPKWRHSSRPKRPLCLNDGHLHPASTPGAHIFCWSRCCHKQGPMQAFITSQPNQKSTCDGYDESWYLGVYHIHRFSTSMCTECAHIDTTYRYVTTCLFLGKEKHHCPRSTSNFRGCKSPNQESIGRSIPPWNNRSIHRESHRNHFQHKLSIHQAMTETQGLVFQTSAQKYLEHHMGILEKMAGDSRTWKGNNNFMSICSNKTYKTQ